MIKVGLLPYTTALSLVQDSFNYLYNHNRLKVVFLFQSFLVFFITAFKILFNLEFSFVIKDFKAI